MPIKFLGRKIETIFLVNSIWWIAYESSVVAIGIISFNFLILAKSSFIYL